MLVEPSGIMIMTTHRETHYTISKNSWIGIGLWNAFSRLLNNLKKNENQSKKKQNPIQTSIRKKQKNKKNKTIQNPIQTSIKKSKKNKPNPNLN